MYLIEYKADLVMCGFNEYCFHAKHLRCIAIYSVHILVIGQLPNTMRENINAVHGAYS